MPQKMLSVLGWRPKDAIPLHTLGQKRCFCITKLVVFETHAYVCTPWGRNVVAPQTRIPLQTLGQRRCFWIPKMVVFETHVATKNALGSGVAPQARIILHTMGQKRCVLDT